MIRKRKAMKIAILGIGAIGSYISAKLSQLDSVELYLLALSNFDVIQKDGIVLTDAQSENQEAIIFTRFSLFRHMHEMPKCNVIIICVKTSQTTSVF